MRAALVFVFVCAVLVFAWARRDLPKDIGEWKARAWLSNPRIFYSGMMAASKYRSSVATRFWWVCWYFLPL
jgi:uncharacterized membrane protein (DUF106 family)